MKNRIIKSMISFLTIVIFIIAAVGSSSVDIYDEEAVKEDMQGTWIGNSHDGIGEFQYMHYKVEFNGNKFKGWIQAARTDREPSWETKPDVVGTWSLSEVLTFTNSASNYRNIYFSEDDGNLLTARTLQQMIIWDNGLYVAGWAHMSQKSKPKKNISEKKTKEKKSTEQNISNTQTLSIVGENIWVRSSPSTGDVVMKLNTGDKCEILEKGKFEEIRDMYDFWYKIRFNGQVGWVYGSQTNLKTDYSYYDAVNKGLINQAKPALNSIQTLQSFFKEYFSNNNNLNRFVHSSIGFYILNNPGSMCYGSKSNSISIKNFGIQPKNVFNGIPEGDHCGGYENSSDGFYYETINRDDLPIFTTDGENISKVPIPYNYEGNNIVKVCIVKNTSWLADFYFIKINGEYFIICQDFCDCSA